MGQEFKCDKCGKTFTRPQGLALHRKAIHGIKPKTTTRRRRVGKQKEAVMVKFCPNCGVRLDVVEKALELTYAAH